MMEGNILLPLVSCSRRFDFSSLSFFPCFIHRCINTSASDFFLFTSHQMVIDILKSDIDLQARPGLRNSIISKDILAILSLLFSFNFRAFLSQLYSASSTQRWDKYSLQSHWETSCVRTNNIITFLIAGCWDIQEEILPQKQ